MGSKLLRCCINKRFSDCESDRQILNKNYNLTTFSQNSAPTLVTNYSSSIINKKFKKKKTAKFMNLSKKCYLMEDEAIKCDQNGTKQKINKLKLSDTKTFLERENTIGINLRINKIINKHFRINTIVRDPKR